MSDIDISYCSCNILGVTVYILKVMQLLECVLTHGTNRLCPFSLIRLMKKSEQAIRFQQLSCWLNKKFVANAPFCIVPPYLNFCNYKIMLFTWMKWRFLLSFFCRFLYNYKTLQFNSQTAFFLFYNCQFFCWHLFLSIRINCRKIYKKDKILKSLDNFDIFKVI